MRIEVAPDETAPNGGRAKLILEGVWGLPPAAGFRIVCLDPSRLLDALDWPQGERRPIETRQSSQGIELIVGPDIVDAPALAPGTPVRIVVPAIGLEQELFWPNIPTSPPAGSSSPVVASVTDLIEAAAAREKALAAAAAAARSDAADAPGGPLPPSALPVAAPRDEARSSTPSGSRQAAPAGSPVQSSRGGDRKGAYIAFVAGALASALLILSAGLGLGIYSGAGRVAPVAAAVPPGPLAEVVTVGATSPGGRKAEGVDFETLLGLADFSLRDGTSRAESQEARFWLQRTLVEAVGSERLLWAMTQLGAIFANTGGADAARASNQAKARALWELSAALGDHVANCFMARVLGQGIGVPADPPRAARYREAALAGGDCPQARSASDGTALFVDARRSPSASSKRPDAVAAESRQWARERQEIRRALNEAIAQGKQDREKVVELEASLVRVNEEAKKLLGDLASREADARTWSSNVNALQARLLAIQKQHAQLGTELTSERERRALVEAQLAKRNEQEAFEAALATARRLAAEAAGQVKDAARAGTESRR